MKVNSLKVNCLHIPLISSVSKLLYIVTNVLNILKRNTPEVQSISISVAHKVIMNSSLNWYWSFSLQEYSSNLFYFCCYRNCYWREKGRKGADAEWNPHIKTWRKASAVIAWHSRCFLTISGSLKFKVVPVAGSPSQPIGHFCGRGLQLCPIVKDNKQFSTMEMSKTSKYFILKTPLNHILSLFSKPVLPFGARSSSGPCFSLPGCSLTRGLLRRMKDQQPAKTCSLGTKQGLNVGEKEGKQ